MVEGEKKGFWDKALSRARKESKRLQNSLRRRDLENEKLKNENDQLRKENENLKEELKLKRGVPDWVKPNKKPGKKKKKKLGPKKGHVSHVRQRPDQIDEEIEIIPRICPHCDRDLPEPNQWHEHVQVDLPPPQKAVVRKFVVGWCYCAGCEKRVSLKKKLSHSQYGPVVHGLVSYWKFSLRLTLGKIHELLLNQYQLDVSTGVLSAMLDRTARRLKASYEDMATELHSQNHLYIDESGWRVGGMNHWLWSYSNEQISYYAIEPTRSQKVLKKTPGQHFSGIVISDFYGGYHCLDSPKQKCWVHLLRDLKKFREKHPHSKEIKTYEARMKRFYQRAISLQQDYEQGHKMESRFKRLQTETETWVFKRYRHPQLKKLSKRLRKYRNELYTFVKTGIDGTNNAAEREIRPAVVMRKISYGNRSEQGALNQAILMSHIRTCHKQGTSFTQLAQDALRRPLQ